MMNSTQIPTPTPPKEGREMTTVIAGLTRNLCDPCAFPLWRRQGEVSATFAVKNNHKINIITLKSQFRQQQEIIKSFYINL